MELGNVICEYATEYNGELYFSTYHGNSLYRYNKKSDDSHKIGPVVKKPLPGTKMSRLYKKICPVGRKMYLFPWTGESVIGVYDLDSEELESIDISMYDSGQHEKTEFKICDCFEYDKYLYAIGLNYPAVLRIDTQDNTISCVVDFRNKQNVGSWHLYLGYGVRRDNIAYIPILEESAFLKIDLETGKTNTIDIEGHFSGFTNLILDLENHVYLLEKWTNRIVCVESNGGIISIQEVPDCPPKQIEEASYFDCLIHEGNGFYLFPVKANHIYFYDFDKKGFEVCNEFEEIMGREYKDNSDKNGRIYGFSHKDHYAIVIEGTNKTWYEINLSDRSVSPFEMRVAKNAIVKMWNYCKEDDKKTLNGFIEYLDLLERYNVNPAQYI